MTASALFLLGLAPEAPSGWSTLMVVHRLWDALSMVIPLS
jgi:hypothetical protein